MENKMTVYERAMGLHEKNTIAIAKLVREYEDQLRSDTKEEK